MSNEQQPMQDKALNELIEEQDFLEFNLQPKEIESASKSKRERRKSSRRRRKKHQEPQFEVFGRFKNEDKIRQALAKPDLYEKIMLKVYQEYKDDDEKVVPRIVRLCELATEAPGVDMRVEIVSDIIFLMYKRNKQQTTEVGSIDKYLLSRVIPIIEKATSMDPRLSTPAHFNAFADGVYNNLLSVSEEATKYFNLFAPIIETGIRNSYYGDKLDGLSAEDFRVGSLVDNKIKERGQHIRKYMLRYFNYSQIGGNIFLKYFKDHLMPYIEVHEPDPEQLMDALFDPTHPRHNDVKQMERTLLVTASPEEVFPQLLQFVVLNNSTGHGSLEKVGQELRNRDVDDRLDFVREEIIEYIYGKKGSDKFLSYKAMVQGGMDRFDFSGLTHEPNLAVFNVYDGVMEHQLLTKKVDIDNFNLGEINFSEEEAKKTFHEYLEGITYDVLNASVDFQSSSRRIGDVYVTVTAKENFPCVHVQILNSEYQYVAFDLNDKLEVEGLDMASDSAEISRAYAIALMHDKLTIQGAKFKEEQQTDAISHAPSSSTRGSRVIRSGKHIVMVPKDQNADDVKVTVTPDESGEAIAINVENRAHWREVAPELVKRARLQTMELIHEYGGVLDGYGSDLWQGITDEEWKKLRSIIEHSQSHRLNTRQILHAALKHKPEDMKKLLEEFEEVESDQYSMLLQVHQDTKGAKMPALFPKGNKKWKRESTYIRQRMDEDGRVESMPDRQRPTQNYVSSSGVFTRTVKLDKQSAKVGKYRVIKGGSTLEALNNILHS